MPGRVGAKFYFGLDSFRDVTFFYPDSDTLSQGAACRLEFMICASAILGCRFGYPSCDSFRILDNCRASLVLMDLESSVFG